MRHGRWLFSIACGWLLLALIGQLLLRLGANVALTLLFSQQILLAVGGWLGLGERRRELIRLEWSECYKGFFSGVGLFFLNMLLGALVILALSHFWGIETVTAWLAEEQLAVEALISLAQDSYLWLIGFLVVIGASLSEELFFRGLLLDALRQRLRPGYAVFITSFLFAAVHFYLIQFIPVLVAGILLGLLFLRRQNLLRPIIAHSTVNGLVFLLSFSLR